MEFLKECQNIYNEGLGDCPKFWDYIQKWIKQETASLYLVFCHALYESRLTESKVTFRLDTGLSNDDLMVGRMLGSTTDNKFSNHFHQLQFC